MTHRRFIGTVILATLVAGLPAAATAQDEPLATPEGADWTLISYLDTETAEVISVPFGVTANLLLQDGAASGSSQMSSLMTELQGLRTEIDTLTNEAVTLRDELDAQNVVQLRQRIKALEADDKKLTKRLDTLEKTPKPTTKPNTPTDAALDQWEQVLLKAIPGRIAKTCDPLRTSLPTGTQAALTCTPNTAAVASSEYYLMEGDDAAAAYQATMSEFNVPQATSSTKTCAQGIKSQRQWIGGGWQADGCYRSDGRAEVRFIDNATDCRKLKVSGTTLQSPSIYMSLQGKGKDIKDVYTWATKGLDPQERWITSLTVPIERPNAAISPSCPQ